LVRAEDCIGCAACSSTAPENFGFVDRVAFVIRQPHDSAEAECCEAARLGCPGAAIVVAEDHMEGS
jgi:ferredoxin